MENKEIKTVMEGFSLPRWDRLPDVELYSDQLVNYINKALAPLTGDMPVLTKTMINNYVKNELVMAPVNKMYGKNQIAKLFVICIVKRVFSMDEIGRLTEIALQGSTIHETYDCFCSLFEDALESVHTGRSFIFEDDEEKIYNIKLILQTCAGKFYIENKLLDEG